VSGFSKLLRYVEFEESCVFGEIMWNLDFLVVPLNFIVVSLLFCGFLFFYHCLCIDILKYIDLSIGLLYSYIHIHV
jgi:hypothetical protein